MSQATAHPVILYARASQARDERSKSVDDQLAELRRWAAREDWPVLGEHRDDNVSASRYAAGHDRPGWQRAMADVASGRARALLVWEFSRGTRDLRVFTALEEACRTHRVRLGYSGRLHDLATADGGFSAGLDALLAAKESAMTSERTRRAVESRAAGGRPHGSVPYGYRRKIDPATGMVTGREIDPDTGAIVREIVERLLGGESAGRVADGLNRRGVRTAGAGRCTPGCPCRKGNRGRPDADWPGDHVEVSGQWQPGNLAKLAQRPTYAGLRVHHGRVLDDVAATWPAIITREQYDRLRVLFGDPTRDKFRGDTRVKHLGSGIYRCGRGGCDGVMRRVVAHGGSYDCRTCHGVVRRQTPVDQLVEAVLVERLRRPDVLALLAGPDRTGERAVAADLVARLRAEEADMRRLLASGDLSPGDMAAWRDGFRPRLEEAEGAAAPPTAPGPVAEIAGQDAEQQWADAPIEVKRAVLNSLMTVTILPVGRSSVRFDPDGVKIEWKGHVVNGAPATVVSTTERRG